MDTRKNLGREWYAKESFKGWTPDTSERKNRK